MAREPLTRAEFLRIRTAGAGAIVVPRGSEDAPAALPGADDGLDRAAPDGNLGRRATAPSPAVVCGTPVATLARPARGAGAKRVRLMDHPSSSSADTGWATSTIPGGRRRRQPLCTAIVDCGVLRNVPIAGRRASAGLALSGKTMMGRMRDRRHMHTPGLDRTIAELEATRRADPTVLDAIRILGRRDGARKGRSPRPRHPQVRGLSGR